MTKRRAGDETLAYTQVRVADLIPYARNARTHSDEQVAKLAASIREFGFLNPVITDGENGILAGHGRILAAQKLGLESVPAIEAAHLTEAQRRAYILADNRLALDAGWDEDMLKIELADLDADGFDLDLTGFDMGEIGKLMDEPREGLTDPDATPEARDEAVTVPGDVWLLGRHRLVCGDSTDADVVAKCLGGVEPHLMVTDPPYGVEYDADWRNSALGSPIGGRAVGKVHNDDRADWREAWALFPGDVAYVWCAPGPLNCTVHDSLADSGLVPRMQIVWAKSQFAIGRGHYHAQHENCWYAVKKGKASNWQGDRKQSTLWQIDKPRKSETGHSTQKPVECMKRPIENNSSPGQAVYDPFSGSGTTIIAGEMTGRYVHAIEISPAYVDVAIRRWQEFTGQAATLEGDGRSFAEIEAERGVTNAA